MLAHLLVVELANDALEADRRGGRQLMEVLGYSYQGRSGACVRSGARECETVGRHLSEMVASVLQGR